MSVQSRVCLSPKSILHCRKPNVWVGKISTDCAGAGFHIHDSLRAITSSAPPLQIHGRRAAIAKIGLHTFHCIYAPCVERLPVAEHRQVFMDMVRQHVLCVEQAQEGALVWTMGDLNLHQLCDPLLRRRAGLSPSGTMAVWLQDHLEQNGLAALRTPATRR